MHIATLTHKYEMETGDLQETHLNEKLLKSWNQTKNCGEGFIVGPKLKEKVEQINLFKVYTGWFFNIAKNSKD